ncbi:hypothetical protein [Halomonas aquatica]|uniref:hypothetical protein n=1 Tax=Halomonas aquatica TaxID=3151123 RepID=UPI003D80CE30
MRMMRVDHYGAPGPSSRQAILCDACLFLQKLAQNLPLPLECETFATPEAPLLGLSTRIDPALLSAS